MRILLDELGALARMLLKVAFVLELATHVARHGAIAAAFAQTARLTGLLGSRPLLPRRAGRLAIILTDAVSVHYVGCDARVILFACACWEAEKSVHVYGEANLETLRPSPYSLY